MNNKNINIETIHKQEYFIYYYNCLHYIDVGFYFMKF